MDRKDLTFRRMVVRDVNGKVVSENIVAVDRNEIEKDTDVKTFGYVGGIDYFESPEGSFKEYSNVEKSKLGYGQRMNAFDKIQAGKLGMNATFEMLSCENMKSAMQAFQQAYPNIQVPTNTKQMEKILSDTNLATNTAYTASMNLSKDEITTQYNCLKACYELGGVLSYDNEGARRVGNYNTLSAFDKDFVDAACKEQAYAEDVSIVMAADRYGLVNAPKKVSGFDLTPIDRLSLDASGVSLSHNIGVHSSEGFLVSKDANGNYNMESTEYMNKISVNTVVETKDMVTKQAENFASGVKTSVILKYHKFRNMLTDARDHVNDDVNQGIVNVSDKFIRNIQNVRNNAERRIKHSNNTINVNKVFAQGAEISKSAFERQGEFVTE